MTADFCNVTIRNVKNLVPNFFDKENYMIHYGNLQRYLMLGLKLKKMHLVSEFNQSQWLKRYIEFITQNNRSRKNGKVLNKLMNNIIYGETIENLRNKIDF